ncbi:MAG: transglutaminase family protein [Verrucomicrobia bacterium]|nr:MAG: transglutaminase family protein [Verrucomicrobiota bacterium]
MKLQIVHRTHYTYAGPVRESFNEVRLKPVSNEHQRCDAFVLKILPATRLRHYEDFYANCVHHFEIPEHHASLSIEADCTVVTNRANWLDPAATPFPLARVAECARMERCFDYLQPSSYVELGPEVWRLALDIAAGHTDLWQAAQALMHWVHANFVYAPRSTNAHTRMTEALARRTGVCQDFAHVLIGLCRAIQIPALYVSGYFYTPNSDATHAWVEVFIPDVGWRALDPTHDCQPDERYVKIAVGRDYADVPPTRGHYKGTQERRMEIAVRIHEITG